MEKTIKTPYALLAATTILAGAAQADAIKGFNIGVLGGGNAQDRMTLNVCYRAVIEAKLGVPVKVFTPADCDGVIQGLVGGMLDMAWLGASAYAKIYLTDPKVVDFERTTMPEDGSTGYYAFSFARKESGIKTMDDAKGKVFAFGEPNSTSGYLVPASELPAKHGDLAKFFKETKFSGGHEQTIVGVARGDFDASVSFADGLGNWEDGFTYGAFRKAADAGLVNMNDVVQIRQSKLIPEGPLVVRAALPQALKDGVTKLLADLSTTNPACAVKGNGGDLMGFVPVDPAIFAGILAARKLADKIN